MLATTSTARFLSGCLRSTATVAIASSKLHVQSLFQHDVMNALPVFPDLHEYPYDVSASRQIMEKRREVHADHKQVEIRTCGTLYRKWRKEKRYWTVPDGNIPFTVKYLDTGCRTNDSPLVVLLHGSPGSYDNFSQMTSYLRRQNVRIIAPCFPDIMTYRMGRFRHTPEEKCEFVKDFLRTIKIPKVDMIVCHSSSLFPGVLLCKDKQLPVGSLTLLNPTAYEYPKVLKPLHVIQFLSRLFEFPIGTEIVSGIGQMLVKTKSQLKGNNYFDHFLSAFTMVSSEVPKRAVDFNELICKDFPVMLAFSENDKLIGKRALYNMAKMMVKESEIQRYDGSGKLQTDQNTEENSIRKVLAFKEGTHFVFQKHPEVIAERINSFLHSILKKY